MTTTPQPPNDRRDVRTDDPAPATDPPSRWTRVEIATADAALAAALLAVALTAVAASTGDPELLATAALVGVGVSLLGLGLLRLGVRVRRRADVPCAPA